MAREGKESLMFSLFNKSKANKEEQVAQQEPVEKIEPPEEKVEISFIDSLKWVNFKFNESDVRFANLKLAIDSQHMYAKMQRVFVPKEPEISKEDLEKAEKQIAEGESKNYGDERLLNEVQGLIKTEMQGANENAAQEPKAALASQGESAPQDETAPQGESTPKDETASQDETTPKPEIAPEPEWDIEFLHKALDIAKVNTGILENELQKVLSEPFNTDYIVAQGTMAIPGKDDVVTDYFSRDSGPKFETRPDGSIDFKNMHLVTNVVKGTVICEITAGEPGIPGINVHGNALPPRSGATKLLPRGENTETEDAPPISRLLSAADGNLIFKNDRFSVESVYKVNGNVDNGVGNINFTGDVIVTGDVLEGYEIRTSRSIKVFGMVEGASLYAGEDIHLEKGINGMSKGILEAGGEITAKFIENCRVRTGKDIASESIINCTMECDGNIKVTGKGLISGGKCTAFGSIEARTVGSRASTPTMIILGMTSSILRERNDVEKQLKDVTSQLFEIRKNVIYLEQTIEQCDKQDKILAAQKILSAQGGKTTILTLKKKRLEIRKEEIAEEIRNVSTCTLTCSDIFPPARITIGNATLVIKEAGNNCRFYRNSDGEISMGMK